MPPYIQKLSKDTVGYKGQYDLPEAHWSRGGVTATMMRFIQAFCERRDLQGNEEYVLIAPTLGFWYWFFVRPYGSACKPLSPNPQYSIQIWGPVKYIWITIGQLMGPSLISK